MNKQAFEKAMDQMLEVSIQGINRVAIIKQREITEKDQIIKQLAQNSLKSCTNAQLLKELAWRISLGRLELEGFKLDGLIKIPTEIWDNEWADRTKPDFTGARTNLTYWLTEAKQLMEENHA